MSVTDGEIRLKYVRVSAKKWPWGGGGLYSKISKPPPQSGPCLQLISVGTSSGGYSTWYGTLVLMKRKI